MIPGKLDLALYRGDTFYGPLITIPSLTSFGGPASISASGVFVKAQIRAKANSPDPIAEFAVTEPNSDNQVRLKLAPSATAELVGRSAVWDLQVKDTSTNWVGTVLAGTITITGEVTRP
jgi:hypothetical protein